MPRAQLARLILLLGGAFALLNAPVRGAADREALPGEPQLNASASREIAYAAGQPEPVRTPVTAPKATPPSEPAPPPAAQQMASAALQAAKREHTVATLPTAGKPGDVRLVCMRTEVVTRGRWIVPPLPVYPFSMWNRWLDENAPKATHCAIDWMDEQGRWWHTEIRGFEHHDARYRVGQGEFTGSGVTVYGVFVLPGRSDPEGLEVVLDEPVSCDYRIIEAEARKYGRLDKRRGEPGTGGRGKENVGLGGPSFKPSQNSNTFVRYLLERVNVKREAPPGAIGWNTVPHFPYSSDADAYGR